MSWTFVPHLNVLSGGQRALWPSLGVVTHLGFVLYGGTAVALRLGHRESVDFDFFSERSLKRTRLDHDLPFLDRASVLQDEPNSLTTMVRNLEDEVKLSFFGAIGFGRVGEPQFTEDGILQVASMEDLMATKLKVILQRAESKNYLDIAATLHAGVNLADGLAAARALFGPAFQPAESLKALTYFQDGDLPTIGIESRNTLIAASSGVRELRSVKIRSASLTAG